MIDKIIIFLYIENIIFEFSIIVLFVICCKSVVLKYIRIFILFIYAYILFIYYYILFISTYTLIIYTIKFIYISIPHSFTLHFLAPIILLLLTLYRLDFSYISLILYICKFYFYIHMRYFTIICKHTSNIYYYSLLLSIPIIFIFIFILYLSYIFNIWHKFLQLVFNCF